ncbi:hypothetical protein DH2020_005471 [Rehmannia glutinosa]|uniref:F-box domain-containing protein n=1 Tax=Rehmannia glutinosa TaxID=99300 RepID=A0ABR0XG59_REHGL
MSRRQSAKMAESLTDLPPNILMEILVRLPLKSLFISRCVCKTFLSLTTPNSHFIDLHSSNATQILGFQFGDVFNPSKLLRLAEPELDIALENFVLKPLYQLPQMGTSVVMYRTNYREDNKLVLVNSCNSLLYFVRRHAPDERSLVCNPVTSEYLIIPDVDRKIRLESRTKSMWLGFSPGTNQYKVLRISSSVNGEYVEVGAQVFVIGSSSWREIEALPLGNDHSWDLCSTFLNGAMYWLDDQSYRDIVFFDFERERFGDVALPPEFGDEQLKNKHCMSTGVLGGCLCVSYNDFNAQHVDLWVMRKRGDRESWIKEFVVDTVRPRAGPVFGRFKPLQVLRNGEVLMLWINNDLVCYDPRRKSLRFVGFHWLRMTTPRNVAFTPSFIPLKDALLVDRVNRYIRPRYKRALETVLM